MPPEQDCALLAPYQAKTAHQRRWKKAARRCHGTEANGSAARCASQAFQQGLGPGANDFVTESKAGSQFLEQY